MIITQKTLHICENKKNVLINILSWYACVHKYRSAVLLLLPISVTRTSSSNVQAQAFVYQKAGTVTVHLTVMINQTSQKLVSKLNVNLDILSVAILTVFLRPTYVTVKTIVAMALTRMLNYMLVHHHLLSVNPISGSVQT